MHAERSLDLRRPEVVPEVYEEVAGINTSVLLGESLSVAKFPHPPEHSESPRQLVEVSVIGKYHPALNCCDVVREVEAKGRQMAETPHPLPAVFGSVGLAAVFDDEEVVRTRQLH